MTTLATLEQLLREQADLPPIDRWHPELCGDIDIFIDNDGRWFHEGRPFAREALVRLFASILRREADGRYYLVTPAEKMRIRVEDVPFLAVASDAAGAGTGQTVVFTLNTGRKVLLDATHPLVIRGTADLPRPYLELEHGLAARLSRPVYYTLVDLAAEHQGETGVWSGGAWFPLTPPVAAEQ